MSFTEALEYVIKGHNIPKILTIVLVAIILGVSIIVSAIAFQSLWILLLLLPVLLGYSLFVSGYVISVIKAVMNSEDLMPVFSVGQNIGRGAVLLVARIVYALPLIILLIIVSVIFTQFAGKSFDPSDVNQSMTLILMSCGFGLFAIIFSIILNFSLIVGQIRYAAEDSAAALFNIGANFSTVMSNLGASGGLLVRLIGIGIVFGIGTNVALNVVSAFFSGVSNQMVFEIQRGNLDAVTALGMPLALLGSLSLTIMLATGLMQNLSVAHLMAAYGVELGLAPNKLKNDMQSSGNNALLIVIAMVILLGLIACGTIFVLALLGPVIGNVFSDVVRELQ